MKRDALTIQVHCVWALCELGAPEAVTLARELWTRPGFRSGYVGEVANYLSAIRTPSVPELIESWLDEDAASLDAADLEAMVEQLKPWAERDVPRGVEGLLRREGVGPSVRSLAWEIVARRGGIKGQNRLREHLREMVKKDLLNEDELAELIAISEFVAQHKLPLRGEFEALLERFAREDAPLIQDAIWTTLTIIVGADFAQPGHRKWLLEDALPSFKKALQRPDQDIGRLSDWLGAFRRCPDEVIDGMARITEAVWPNANCGYRGIPC